MTEPADLVIAGGGPAGLVTAIRAHMCGMRAIVLDPRTPPIDQACGEGIMPDGVSRLAEIGIEISPRLGMPYRGITYIDGELQAQGRFPDAPGWGIRRTRLHAALCERAQNLGVDLRWGAKATGIKDGGFDSSAGVVSGRWLVGADGRNSAVRRWAGLDKKAARRRRYAVRRHFEITPWTDSVEVYWVDGAEAYVTPVSEREVGVALLWSNGRHRFDDLLRSFPRLEARLEGAPSSSTDRGAGPLEQRSRRVVDSNLFLVGDAASFLDPISGEGLSLAFHQSEAAVEAMASNDPSAYARRYREIVRYPKNFTTLLLLLATRPRLRQRVMRSLAGRRGLMSRFLALKLESSKPRIFGSGGLAGLALQALRP